MKRTELQREVNLFNERSLYLNLHRDKSATDTFVCNFIDGFSRFNRIALNDGMICE